MPVVRTDDAARSLKFKWLGPKGHRWPDAYVGELISFAVITILIWGTSWVFMVLPNPLNWARNLSWLALAMFVWFPVWVIVRKTYKRINPERTVSYYVQTLRSDLHAPRPPSKTRTVETVIAPSLFLDHREKRTR